MMSHSRAGVLLPLAIKPTSKSHRLLTFPPPTPPEPHAEQILIFSICVQERAILLDMDEKQQVLQAQLQASLAEMGTLEAQVADRERAVTVRESDLRAHMRAASAGVNALSDVTNHAAPGQVLNRP